MLILETLKALLIGIVQGITEWLPISSTGHMLLLNELFPLSVSQEFLELFTVVIQLGSIMAVAVRFFNRLNPFSQDKTKQKQALSLWCKVALASIPVALVGYFFDDKLSELLYTNGNVAAIIIAISLIVYGVAFILVERLKKTPPVSEGVSTKKAFLIGCFESLAVIPGTSRSGSTILGARLLGETRTVATEFSFFLAIPAMLGASALKAVKFVSSGISMSGEEGIILAVGCLSAFFVSLAVIGFLTDFVKKHSFVPFGIYRILLGVAVILWMVLK